MEAAFAPLDDVEIRLFEPAGAPPAKTMEVGTDRPRIPSWALPGVWNAWRA